MFYLNFFIILLLFVQRISCQGVVSFANCSANPESIHSWWHVLRIGTKKLDPCQLAAKANITHCQDEAQHCAFQQYNILAACIACVLFPNNSDPPSTFELNATAQKNATLGQILSLSATINSSLPSSHFFPRWVQFRYNPIFDPQEAVHLVVDSFHNQPTTSSSSIMSISPNTPTVVFTTETNTLQASASSSSTIRATSASNAGAIAGGVVGGVLFLSLVTIGILYYRRRRNHHRVAPSAEFMFLAGPRATYARTLNDSPPPPTYMHRNTPDPVLEKAYRSAEMQRRLDSSDSSTFAWEHHA